ncbi:antitoxin Xre-like helix-turn-helix domain-containing protein [Nitratireductor sp. XY-223]|uniref:antitoxin Xre-like helix-turn-helix domain-containing protein n=1 Tax=Nitratireductor sp. XY-223 TaxID=2561926 RepID=UPI001FEF71F2|nr:antitoxin Xre-like helix-turn-helix domain-containing protein [Nitratireductor sp. XY-223]
MAPQPLQKEFAGPGAGLATMDDDRVAAVAAKAYARIVAAWKLNNRLAADLIAVSPRTWARMKSGQWTGRLNRDQLLRVSAITGLYKALHLYFSDALADRWVGLRNSGPIFSGREPVEAMIEGGLPAIMETRNYVDALRGGA